MVFIRGFALRLALKGGFKHKQGNSYHLLPRIFRTDSVKYNRKGNLPTKISKLFNLYPQPSPLLTMYTSETGCTCTRSTLHQAIPVYAVCVHDPLE